MLQDQDSWGGSVGHSAGKVYVFRFDEDVLTESVHCRRAYLHCNGIDTCKHFDQDILKGCEHYELDPDKMRELWYHELDVNSHEALEEVNIVLRYGSVIHLEVTRFTTNRFYTKIQKLKCKVPCTGHPMMRKLASVCLGSFIILVDLWSLKGRSKVGKDYFIGCSGWKSTERDKHWLLPIPSNIDEDILMKVMANNGVLPSNVTATLNPTCMLAVHPRAALKACHK